MNRGLTLIDILVIVVVLAILAAFLIPSMRPFRINHRITACANNLSQLYKMAQIYQAKNRGQYPSAQGSAFWLTLQKTDPPLIEAELSEIFFCPMKGEFRGPGSTDYRGPAGPLNQYNDADPLGADVVGNHDKEEGINVVRLSGDVVTVYRNDPLWAACDAKLSK